MKALARMAIRNLLRNRRRSLLTASAIAAATAFLIFLLTYMNGITDLILREMTKITGHARIIHREYKKAERYLSLSYPVANYEELLARLRNERWLTAAVARVRFGTLMDFQERNIPAIATGIDPENEKEVLGLERHITAGNYFLAPTGEILVGCELAKKLHICPGNRITLISRTRYGSMSGRNFRVAGIFNLGTAALNNICYITLADTGSFLEFENNATEILLFGQAHTSSLAGIHSLRQRNILPDELLLVSWNENPLVVTLYPVLRFAISLILGIIGLLALLVVLNTMLMVVLERAGEIGLLGALGATRLEIVSLMIMEAAFLGIAGGITGIIPGVLGSLYLEYHGIYIGDMTKKISIPLSETIYGKVSPTAIILIFLFGVFISITGAAYPAFRASKINPAIAMQKK